MADVSPYLYADPDDANPFFLTKRWDSREQYSEHREWATAQERSKDLLSLLDGEMTTKYLEDTVP
jgi:quinol monooxygenase YgiN